MTRRLAFTILAAALLASPAIRAQEPLPGDGRPEALTEVSIEQRLNERIPLDLPFVDEAGRPVVLGDYFGDRPVVLALVYYECPMLCTLVLNGLTGSLGLLEFEPGREFDVVAVSIDPGEGPELAAAKKRAHLEEYGRPGTESGWHFLTGEPGAIRDLADAVGFRYRYDPVSGEYAHAAGIMVLTPEGTLARYFYGVDYPPRDMRFALMEASQSRIGTLADQLLLFCYQYDPATGTYGAATYFLLRAAALLTVLGLVTGILLMRLRERRLASKHA